MKTTTLIILILLGISPVTFSQPKAYQANQQELAFPSEVVQNCFGIDRGHANIIQIRQGTGHISLNKSFIGQRICIGKKTYDQGIGVFTTSSMLVHLLKPVTRFGAEIGIDNNVQTHSNKDYKVIFSIEADGKVLWSSPPLGLNDPALVVDVPLNGITDFYLNVKSIESHDSGCQADWANAFVSYGKDEKVGLENYFNKTSALRELPWSFVMDGISSRSFLDSWHFSVSDSLAQDCIIHQIKWTKPDGTFEVRCLLSEFTNYPVVEWRLFFKNTGSKNSPILEHILPLDARVFEPARLFSNNERGKAILHCNRGSSNSNTDFMPINTILENNLNFQIYSSPELGRSSMSYLPFWNLEFHRCGLITAIGWSGDWKANFSFPASDRIGMEAGMSNCNLFLKPGEEVSSPSVCLLYWEGDDALRGNNLFRRYMRDEVVPKWNGKEPVTYAMSGGSSALETVNERNQVDYIRKIAGTGATVYWLDAGWYDGPEGGEWSVGRGNWYPDPKKFPNGMKVLADEAHKKGLKFLLWFDPETVDQGSDIARKHPEMLIWRKGGKMALFNLGDPKALKYMTDLISKNLINWNVDVFRNDYNIDPAPMWKSADEPGRSGMTEIRYVEGLYKFWDELLRRKPDLLIDNCASGGRRVDYETCKRSVPLWRSDYSCDLYPDLFEASQNQTYGLEFYLPFNSTGQTITYNKYKDRSLSTNSVVLSIGTKTPGELADVPFEKVKKVWNNIKSYCYLMSCDYYPLSDYSLTGNSNVIFQFDCPEKNEGCVICFRRADSPYPETELVLRAIDPLATYNIIDVDTGTEQMMKGAQLKKFAVRMDPLESRVLKYV